MNLDAITQRKQTCRGFFESIRRKLSFERREEASKTSCEFFLSFIPHNTLVLSFASINNEINLWPLNEELAKRKQLVLPRVEKEHLDLFFVEKISSLIPNRWNILEPNPAICEPIATSQLSIALIPGLAFDFSNKHRLGYGKGYYDRLLQHIPSSVQCFGVGFKEQLTKDLPFSKHDRVLSGLYFF